MIDLLKSKIEKEWFQSCFATENILDSPEKILLESVLEGMALPLFATTIISHKNTKTIHSAD